MPAHDVPTGSSPAPDEVDSVLASLQYSYDQYSDVANRMRVRRESKETIDRIINHRIATTLQELRTKAEKYRITRINDEAVSPLDNAYIETEAVIVENIDALLNKVGGEVGE